MKNKSLILNTICGVGIALSTAGGLFYVAKDNCPDYVGRVSLLTLLASASGAIYNDCRKNSEKFKEPEYYL